MLDSLKRTVLSELDSCIKEIVHERSSGACGQVLHYTNTQGLIGILKHGIFHAGNLIAMNDSDEFYGAVEIVKDCCRSDLSSENSSVILRYILGRLENLEEPPYSFVSSFTGKADATTHWQSYGKQSGFALHFDKGEMTKIAISKGYLVGDCIYKKEDQIAFLKTAFDRITQRLKIIAAANQQITQDDINFVSEAILYSIARLSPLIKSEHFSHEAEWRCWRYLNWDGVHLQVEEVEFFEKSGILTGKLNLDLKSPKTSKLPLTHVTVGPSAHIKPNVLTSNAYLQATGYANVRATASSSTYRSI